MSMEHALRLMAARYGVKEGSRAGSLPLGRLYLQRIFISWTRILDQDLAMLQKPSVLTFGVYIIHINTYEYI